MIDSMPRRGVFLILVFAALLDLGSPLLPETSEALERSEEVAHGRARVARQVRSAPARQVGSLTGTSVTAPRPARRASSARRSPEPSRGPHRKIPLSSSDPESSPDAH